MNPSSEEKKDELRLVSVNAKRSKSSRGKVERVRLSKFGSKAAYILIEN